MNERSLFALSVFSVSCPNPVKKVSEWSQHWSIIPTTEVGEEEEDREFSHPSDKIYLTNKRTAGSPQERREGPTEFSWFAESVMVIE